ncbi:hypothetical protein WA158_007388 [Blastocystis sp. Blastoise]
MQIEYPEGQDYYKWFAYLLLTDSIIEPFKSLLPYYINNPKIIIDNSTSKKVLILIQMLMSNKINNKKQLLLKWKSSSNFLKIDILSWIVPRYSNKLNEIWDSIIHDN